MRLTAFTDYSLRVLIYLAVNGERQSTIAEIAGSYGVSRNHLMKVVQELSQAGYVTAQRGKGGGLTLALSPQHINIGKLVRAMESDLALAECFSPGNQCVVTPACSLKGMLAEALEAFFKVLDGYTLADILPPKRRHELAELLNIL